MAVVVAFKYNTMPQEPYTVSILVLYGVEKYIEPCVPHVAPRLPRLRLQLAGI